MRFCDDDVGEKNDLHVLNIISYERCIVSVDFLSNVKKIVFNHDMLTIVMDNAKFYSFFFGCHSVFFFVVCILIHRLRVGMTVELNLFGSMNFNCSSAIPVRCLKSEKALLAFGDHYERKLYSPVFVLIINASLMLARCIIILTVYYDIEEGRKFASFVSAH